MCKDGDESYFLLSCKACEDFRKDVSWFEGSHTSAILNQFFFFSLFFFFSFFFFRFVFSSSCAGLEV